ncbi:1-phosphatidylinositol 4,5-bisphosphate phosphodiesterase delta-1 isoform X2 [Octopus sinensis]|uniref:Phosphoinositide phospholipase C n=1 Tax=Octopus sinensis TaxID=2607531 RepID=A0A6P7T0R7_9MOLL|nr:1-phosphatidylinositol 4,5-bisphosphate phosphodiesterase delta-1 isoform X2 [Octopus sinensis]
MATPEKSKESLEADLKELEKGIVMNKVKHGNQYERIYVLDRDKMVLRYEGSTKVFRKKTPEIALHNIIEIRLGENSHTKRFRNLNKEQCFSIVVGARHNLVTLMSPNENLRDMWVRGLRHVIASEKSAQQEREYDRWIRDAFLSADKNSDGEVDFDELVKLLKSLNARMKKKYILQIFNEANTNKTANRYGKQTLDSEEFVKFYHLLTRRSELEELFKRYVRGKSYLSSGDLLKFLKQQQKEKTVTEDMCKEWIKKFEPDPCFKQQIRLSLLGFQLFLASPEQSIFNPACLQVYQDMKQPMINYFINSSHNTYLLEDQLHGPSSVEAYIRALQKGCRCVELDCWDGNDDEPVIYHGHTLTSKIQLDKVLIAIKEYSFKTSPYPVILSIENHCSLTQQKVMAHQIKTILGNNLYIHDDNAPCPSPHDLMNKILLKMSDEVLPSIPYRKRIKDLIRNGIPTIGQGKKLPPLSTDNDGVSDEDEAEEMEEEKKKAEASREGIEMPKEKIPKKVKLEKSLSELIGIRSQRFTSIEHAVDNGDPFKMTSIGEMKMCNLLEENIVEDNRKLTKAIMVRTYPAGLRTDSSNYTPVMMWNVGCQVVALNYQTEDTPMQLLLGKFLDNGGCGYLLKPSYLLSGKPEVEPSQPKLLAIKVISAYQLPKPSESFKGEVIDPIVKIEIHGMDEDKAEKKTRVIRNNGFNPRWDEDFEFRIDHPDLCILRFTVKDYDLGGDDFIGYFTIPFNCMQEGYRQFNLNNKKNEVIYKSMLLLHIDIKPVS